MIRTILYSLSLLLAALLFFLAVLIFFFNTETDEWLSRSSPVNANIILVEGWLSRNASRDAIKEFNEGNYETLVITGGPLNEVFNLSENGAVEFDLPAAGVDWSVNDTVRIALHAFGEPALGEYARYAIIHGRDTLGREHTHGNMSRYVYYYAVRGQPAEKLYVVFDNDYFTDMEDRNLHIWKIEVDDITIPVRSEYTQHVKSISPGTTGRPLHHKTIADWKAYDMIMAGVDSSRIVTLNIPAVRRFRTFTDAVAFSEWLKEHGSKGDAVNLFTEGNHARRTHILYRYALPDSVNVGVISVERSDYYDRPRFFLSYEKLSNLYQLNAYIYSRLFFNHRWHYRRILKKLAG
jgi:hypothetical protein